MKELHNLVSGEGLSGVERVSGFRRFRGFGATGKSIYARVIEFLTPKSRSQDLDSEWRPSALNLTGCIRLIGTSSPELSQQKDPRC